MLPGEAVRLVYQALQGLQHIHEQGLVHRDLEAVQPDARRRTRIPRCAPR